MLGREPPRLMTLVAGQPVRVPVFFDAEVFAAVRRLLLRGRLTEPEARLALFRLRRVVAKRIGVASLLADAFVLRDRFGAYDVFYAIIARRSDATLVTCDAPFARAAEGYCALEYVAPKSTGSA